MSFSRDLTVCSHGRFNQILFFSQENHRWKMKTNKWEPPIAEEDFLVGARLLHIHLYTVNVEIFAWGKFSRFCLLPENYPT